jgi:orotate phosphoribosyltransferase
MVEGVYKQGDRCPERESARVYQLGDRCLVVEDVVTKGGRALETIQIVQGLQGCVVGVSMVVDRSDGTLDLGVPLIPLIRLDVETFDPLNLPPDLAAIPATKPGSK